MAVEMLEKNDFFKFGNTVDESDMALSGAGYNNFIGAVIPGLIIARGRKKRADKNRQAIQDKYANLDVSCNGIDGSIAMVTKDLSTLKANKPKKKLLSKKDVLAWEAQVSETDVVLNELLSKKRGLICGQAAQTPQSGGVEVVQQMPSTSSGTATMLPPTTRTGAISSLSDGTGTGMGLMPQGDMSGMDYGSGQAEGGIAPAKKSMLWLYIALGVVAVGGVVYFVARKK